MCRREVRRIVHVVAATIALLVGGCAPPGSVLTGTLPVADRQPHVHVEVSISDRKLHVYRDGDRVRTYPIAVGMPTHPTPVGDFEIYQIDWNPDWTPPDSPWAENRAYTPPGHPDNPMGRVRIVYRPPYTIHGTEDVKSLGRAQSHGSIRMSNPDVIALARLLMETAGAERPDAWYVRVLERPHEMVEVELPRHIPLVNRP